MIIKSPYLYICRQCHVDCLSGGCHTIQHMRVVKGAVPGGLKSEVDPKIDIWTKKGKGNAIIHRHGSHIIYMLQIQHV